MIRKFLLTAAVLTGAAGVFAASEPKISYPAYSVEADGGELVIRDYEKKPLLKIGRQLFSWAPPAARPVSAEKVADDTFRITYRIDNDKSGKIALEGTVRALPDGHIRCSWLLDSPETRTGGIMQELQVQKGTEKSKEAYKSGLWTRHEHGGVPFEVRDGYFRSFRNGNIGLWMKVGGNVNYTGSWSDHLGYKKNGDGRYEASLEFVVTPPECEGYEAAALFHKRPLGLKLSTDRPFNLWESGAPELKVALSNPYDTTKKGVAFEVTGRDYDGRVVLDEKRTLEFGPYGSKLLKFSLPEAERMIYFVEAKVTVPGEKEIFARTNLAVLPPHEYGHRDESRFALSAYFMIPSAEDVYALMKRIGVRTLRHGDNRVTSKYGILSLDHASVGPNDSPEKVAKRIAEMVRRASGRQNPAIEFCNEWNMNQKGGEKLRRARRYVEVLREFKALRDREYPGLRIIGMGMAGADTGFLKMMAENGAVPLMDGGVAMHPGRGNMTPDYIGEGWTYLGAIRRYRKAMDELGIRTLHLSEVYAATPPNNSWMDSCRNAAENVLLTYAIGLAENAETIQFYQLHDSVWHDLGGVNHEDSEYHYGLLMRDGAVKPSLLAYAAAAEALDGAKFVRYLTFEGKVRGIGFETPRGPLAFLYDRTDGYFLTERKKNFAGTEPWVDTWKSRRKATFDAVGGEVTAVDPIGRAAKIPAKDGKVTLELSGAPLMVYGIRF
ncbi:MAG: hypothetical protein HPZ91_20455 [Lentisphaeria bacterium]|nr:hypothetical protein [Lentisphaeria bacterium]